MSRTISGRARPFLTDRRISVMVRTACNQYGTPYPIRMVDGFDAPRLAGRSYFWTTPSGKTEVRCPNAYGWPTVYHASTHAIVVGAGWIIETTLRGELTAAEIAEHDRLEWERVLAEPRPAVRFDAEGGFTLG